MTPARLITLCTILVLQSLAVGQAWAKSAAIEWKAVKGAENYDIEIRDSSGTVVLKKRTPSNSWKGSLKPGFYSYQIRGIDWMERGGKWSQPKALALMPDALQLLEPKDGLRFVTYGAKSKVKLRWSAGPGADRYKVTILSGGKLVKETSVQGTELTMELEAAHYEWRIQAQVRSGERGPASAQGKTWESAPGDLFAFTVQHKDLQPPVLRAPLGEQSPPPEGKFLFEWNPVEGATAYELQVARAEAGGVSTVVGRSSTGSAAKSAWIPIRSDGSYSWRVRAIASVAGSTEPEAVAESSAQFQIDRNAVFTKGTGYVSVSTMLAPYTYEMQSPSSSRQLRAQSSAITLRASGEYFPYSRLGFSAAVESTLFEINSTSYQRAGYEVMAKYRLKLDEGKFGWFVAPKAGLELRDYFQLIPIATGPSGVQLQQNKLHALGAAIGVDVRKQLTDRWSVGARLSYFAPIKMVATSQTLEITGDEAHRNLSFGIQGLCWLNPNWGLGAGAFFDHRSISTLQPGANQPERVRTDGTYFFGSLVFKIGRTSEQTGE